MPEPEHTYPSLYPPGSTWAITEAWGILDQLRPGLLDDDTRAFLAGNIAGTLMRLVQKHAHEDTPSTSP